MDIMTDYHYITDEMPVCIADAIKKPRKKLYPQSRDAVNTTPPLMGEEAHLIAERLVREEDPWSHCAVLRQPHLGVQPRFAFTAHSHTEGQRSLLHVHAHAELLAVLGRKLRSYFDAKISTLDSAEGVVHSPRMKI